MNNYFSYLKLCAFEQKITVKELAIESHRNNDYISRILNNKIKNPDSKTLEIIESVLKTDHQLLVKKGNLKLYDLFLKYMNAVYMIEREQRQLFYNHIIALKEDVQNTPDIIYLLMTQMVNDTILKQSSDEFIQIDNKLLHIYETLEDELSDIFTVFHFGFLVLSHQYKKVESFIKRVQDTPLNNSNLKMMINYYFFLYSTQRRNIDDCLHYYEACLKSCEQTANIKRQFNLEIAYSNYLMEIHAYESSIQHNLKLLDISKTQYQYNDEIILNNIAWAHMLLHQYEKALKYYFYAIKISSDMDRYFNISWCYYKLKDYKNARKYITGGRQLQEESIYKLLLDWLEAMINKPYSKKCSEILLKVLKLSDDALADDGKNFVLIQLEDYYYHIGEYEKAHEISHMLIHKYCPSAA